MSEELKDISQEATEKVEATATEEAMASEATEAKTETDAPAKDYTKDVHGKKFSRSLMFALMMIATFGGMLTQTFLGTAYPTLMGKFNITLATAQGASTWFLLANGIMIPVSAFLITKFSTKWLFFAAYIFIWAGIFISFSAPESSWGVFLAGRIVAAMGVGISMPLFQVVIVNIFPPDKIGVPMGLGGLVIGLAPALGPTYAGWILSTHEKFLGFIQLGDWRTIFLIPLIFVGISVILTPFIMHDVLANRDMKLDVFSLLLSLVGFGLFLLGFTNVASDGWGDLTSVILPIFVGLILIIVFVVRQLKMKDPFLDLSVFKVKQFTWTTILAAINTVAMMGVELMLPVYVQNVHGLSAFNAGLLLLPGSIMMAVMSPIAGSIYNKRGAKPLALVGFVILAIGTLPYMFLTASTPEHFITITYWMRFVAIGMIMMPLITSAMNALPVEKAAQGSASNNTLRMIASSIGVALLASVTQNITNHAMPAHSLQQTNPLEYASKAIDAALKGFHVSFAISFAFAVIGFFAAFMLHKGKTVHTPDGREIDALEGGEK